MNFFSSDRAQHQKSQKKTQETNNLVTSKPWVNSSLFSSDNFYVSSKVHKPNCKFLPNIFSACSFLRESGSYRVLPHGHTSIHEITVLLPVYYTVRKNSTCGFQWKSSKKCVFLLSLNSLSTMSQYD